MSSKSFHHSSTQRWNWRRTVLPIFTWRAKASPRVLSGPEAGWDYSTSTPGRIRQTKRHENRGPLSYLQKSISGNSSNWFPYPMHWVSDFSVLRIIPCIVCLKAEFLALSESQNSAVGWQTTQDCPDCPIWVSSTTSWANQPRRTSYPGVVRV